MPSTARGTGGVMLAAVSDRQGDAMSGASTASRGEGALRLAEDGHCRACALARICASRRFRPPNSVCAW